MVTKEEDIIETTINIVAEKGLMNFSSKEIVSRLKCSGALIYKYFETNDVLFQRCGEVIKARHNEMIKDILKNVDILADFHEVNLNIFSAYIAKAAERPNDSNFYYALRGTKYDSIVAMLDDRSTDPLYKAIQRFTGIRNGDDDLEFLITYDYTIKSLNSLVRAISHGLVPNTKETHEKMAKLLCRGVDSFSKE